MRRDLVAFITSAFALAFRRPYLLELCANTIETRTTKRALGLLPLVARKQGDSEAALVVAYVVDVVLTDPMQNSDSSGLDKGGRRSLSVVEAVAVNLASPKRAEARHKI